MASLRILKRRIRSTESTKQIMRAMQLVSGSKLKRAQGRLMEGRAVLKFLDGLLQRVLATMADASHHPSKRTAGWWDHPLAAQRKEGESALVLFTSDAGLCGSYNTNLIQMATAHLDRNGFKKTQVIYIGKKGHRHFTKRGFPATDAYLDLAGRPNLKQAEEIGTALMDRFRSGEVSSVHLLYSKFISAMVYRPTIQQWLPISLDQNGTAGRPRARHSASASMAAAPEGLQYIFEPSARQVFEDLLPRWTLAKFKLIMLEAFTSEHSARMIAMKNATDNAEELISDLTTQRNRIRQAAITTEISEIVGTAEALK